MKTIISIIDLLRMDSWEGISDNIEIAKGRDAMPESFKDGWRQLKREYKQLKVRRNG